jgi:hypothetical protein
MGWQWREVKTFLIETWELFYWSLWWPSKLEGRIKQLSLSDVTLPFQYETSPRIISQLLFIITCLSLPLAILIAHRGQVIDWLFFCCIFFISYGVALLFFSAVFVVPVISTISYFQRPIIWQQGFDISLKLVESWITEQNLKILLLVVLGIALISIISRDDSRGASVTVLAFFGFSISKNLTDILTGIVSSVTTGFVASVVMSFTVIIVVILVTGLVATWVEGFLESIVAASIAGSLAGILAIGIVGILMNITQVPLYLLIVACITISIFLSSTRSKQAGFWLSAVMIALSFEKLSWNSLYSNPI